MPRKYPEEFVADVVAATRQSGESLTFNALRFGVSTTTLGRWLAQDRVDEGEQPGVSTIEKVALAQLQKRNRVLEQENEILRRAAAFFAKDISPK